MDDNVLVGLTAGYNGNSVHFNINVALGNRAMYNIVDAKESVAIGYEALYTDCGDENVAVGHKCGKYNTSIRFTAYGPYAGLNNQSWPNMFMGYNAAGGGTITGSYNTAVGYEAAYALTTGSENTAFGDNAAKDITTGSKNTAIGRNALDDLTTGNFNTAVGWNSLSGS